jgi:Flp pilus assembly protein TadB
MLWALTRGVRDGRAWAWGVLVIAVGLAVLSPHPQLLQYFLLLGGAFALFLALGTHDAGRLERPVLYCCHVRT